MKTLPEINFSISPAFLHGEAVSVVTALDTNYVLLGSALIQSIIDHCRGDRFYDIVVLFEELDDTSRRALLRMAEGHKNISIRCISVRTVFDGLELRTHLQFSRAIYFRLIIPILFRGYPRVIYLDGDTLCCRDVAALYDVDLAGAALGATLDIGILRARSWRMLWIDRFCKYTTEEYLAGYLGLSEKTTYFQSGVLVFSPGNITAEDNNALLSYVMGTKPFALPDQDILNMVFEGRISFIDLRWNVLTAGDPEEVLNTLPAVERNAYAEARKDPYIIHYASSEKPFKEPLMDFAERFWPVSMRTPFYTAFVRQQTSIARPVRRRLRGVIIPMLFPQDSGFRQLAAELFPRGSVRGRLLRQFLFGR